MICPNCETEMQDFSYFVEDVYGFGDEPDYTSTTKIEKHSCKICRIKYHDGEWTLPKYLTPATDKQIKTVNFINQVLGTDCEPLLKHQCCKFIGEHLNNAIKVSENMRDQYFEWHREEYGEFEYY